MSRPSHMAEYTPGLGGGKDGQIDLSHPLIEQLVDIIDGLAVGV
jgi:hypothetical protein